MSHSRGRLVRLSLLGWLAFLSVDFFFHGGLLAGWYENGSPALLPLDRAFARIPVGYLSFFLLVGLIVWLGARLGVRGAAEGLGLGLSIGSVLGASYALGLLSITTIEPRLLVWWGTVQMIELSVVGVVVGHGLKTPKFGRLVLLVAAGAMASLIATVAIQNF